MRYLVTGCAGFIASRVCGMLLQQGDEVVGLDSMNDAYDVRLKHWRLAQLLGKRLEASSDHRLKLDARFPLRSEDGRFSFIKGDTSNKAVPSRSLNQKPCHLDEFRFSDSKVRPDPVG